MENKVRAESRIAMIPIYRISCRAVDRGDYSRRNLRALAASIEKNGILQPIIVRALSPYDFEVVSGMRRIRAAVMAGLSRVPCIILHCSVKQAAVYSLVENIQRESPDIFDRAESLEILTTEYGFGTEQAAARLGITPAEVDRKLNILIFTAKERKILKKEGLTASHIEELARIHDKGTRKKAISKVCKNELNADETAGMVDDILGQRADSSIRRLIVKDLRLFCNTIEHAAATMMKSGIPASIDKNETDDNICYTITITK